MNSVGSPRGGEPLLPAVFIAEQDYERLANLAESGDGPGARLLERELNRSVVVDDVRYRRPFVRLYSTVTFFEPIIGHARQVTLTPPDEADIDEGRLSVTAPVGAALIGLSVGDIFAWRGEDGRDRELAVIRIVGPAAPDAV